MQGPECPASIIKLTRCHRCCVPEDALFDKIRGAEGKGFPVNVESASRHVFIVMS
jgi:hypothetical protein